MKTWPAEKFAPAVERANFFYGGCVDDELNVDFSQNNI